MQDQREARRFRNTCWATGVIAALALLAVITGKIADERGWREYLHLMRQGANCQAVITKIEAGGPCRAEYAFSVAGRSYRGTGPACSASAGQKVTITYLIADPSRSCLGYAGERLANEVVSFFFGGLSFPSLS